MTLEAVVSEWGKVSPLQRGDTAPHIWSDELFRVPHKEQEVMFQGIRIETKHG